MRKRNIILLTIITFLFAVVGCNQSTDSTDTTNSADSTNDTDSELNIAIVSQPSTLDAHMTTEAIVRDVNINIFETLVTLNGDNEPVPMLAESVEESEDGKTYTFDLREDVTFHNGKEMTSEDVLASLERWQEISGVAQENFEGASFEAPDEYTVVLHVKQPQSDVLDLLAGQGQYPAIMPKEIIDSADTEGVEEYVGTGPFEFKEWKQDQYIQLTKYDDYSPVDDPSDGLAGKKEALVNDIYFHITEDTSTLLTGIQTGEFDIAFSVAFDNYEQLQNDDSLDVYNAYFGTMNLVYNKKEGLFSDVKMRQAVNALLDADTAMMGAFASEDLYRMGSSYMNEDVKNWYSEAGKEAYNQADPEKAKRLFEEAGYDGEEITILTSRDIAYHYDIAVIVQEQLNQIGVGAKIDVYDWATHVDKRGDSSQWDLLTAGFNYATTPTQYNAARSDWPGWTDDPKISELMETIRSADSLDEGKEAWDQLQEYAWTEYVPVTQFGAVPVLIAAKDYVEGLTVKDRPIMMPLWNTSVNK